MLLSKRIKVFILIYQRRERIWKFYSRNLGHSSFCSSHFRMASSSVNSNRIEDIIAQTRNLLVDDEPIQLEDSGVEGKHNSNLVLAGKMLAERNYNTGTIQRVLAGMWRLKGEL